MSQPTPAKLTDTQLLILSRAAQRDDHAIDLPPNLKGGAAEKVVTALINGGLAEGAMAKPGMPAWRRDDEDRPLALTLTNHAFDVLGIETDAEADPALAVRSAAENSNERRSKRARPRAGSKREQRRHGGREPGGAPRPGTKQALIVTFLEREQGATLDELVSVTEWLPHTTRAALTGLRKKGYGIAKDKDESGKTVYRIGGHAAPSKNRAAAKPSQAE